ETDEDLAGLAALMRRLKKFGRVQINLGVAHFTPKPHTPFQWHPGSTAAAIGQRLLRVRDLVKSPGLTPRWNAPGASWVETLLARGDRRLGPVLERVFRAGARFEAWGDRFEPRLWAEALAAENLREEILLNPFGRSDPRPYGHLFAGVEDAFLGREMDKAAQGQTTPDCRFGACQNCGACHDGAAVSLAQPAPAPPPETSAVTATRPAGAAGRPEQAVLINFAKEGRAAFLGHLELVELFKRAFRRAGIELAVSQGFHPQPKISFLTALPLGVTSADEYLRVVVIRPGPAPYLVEKLSGHLPPDIAVKSARALIPGRKVQPRAVVWRISTENQICPTGPPLHPGAVLSYTDKNGVREYPLAEFIEAARSEPGAFTLTIRLGLNGTPKPIPAAEALWGLAPGCLVAAQLTKLATILNE
ncbi:MAG: TIGR03936 family radical SAM-associated protein, partial [Candidatus Adiutrix sp.]|nr:TIGR03936 family radical SAM-associated protein [Candidatus Adiutrix sp.]